MSLSVKKYLEQNGPCLSSEISEYFVNEIKLKPEAARQRVSRAGYDVQRLDLSFPKRAKFLFLREQAGSSDYWEKLESALLASNSAYGYAISALNERNGVMPAKHFEIACGSPIKQKKHLAAQTVLERLKGANLVKEIFIEGIGNCVYLGLHTNHISSLIPAMKARLLTEELVLVSIKSWMRKLGFISYNKVAIRNSEKNPKVSTTAWDLAGPSYLSPLVSFPSTSSTPTPGFVVCDILLNDEISEMGIRPFLQKLNALKSLKKVGKQLCFFFGHSFSKEAFNKLKSQGICPATTSVIFDREIALGLKELTETLSNVALKAISPEKIDTIFKRLGKIEGAASRLRGALFEYVIAEAVRYEHSYTIELNRQCRTPSGTKEADVICRNMRKIKFIEGKGYSFNKMVTVQDVDYWLREQVPIFREHALAHPDWKNLEMIFEFWTSSKFEAEALEKLKLVQNNTKKYKIVFKDFSEVSSLIHQTGNKALNKTFSDHFTSNPLNAIANL